MEKKNRKRNRPRPVGYGTIERLAHEAGITPTQLLTVLLNGGASLARRVDLLTTLGVTAGYTRIANLASQTRRFGVRRDGRVLYWDGAALVPQKPAKKPACGAVGSNPTSSTETGVEPVRAAILAAGLDPAVWELSPRQGVYMTGPDGQRVRLAVTKSAPKPDEGAVARLLASAMPEYPAAVPPRTEGGAYCLCLADFQTGKAGEAYGGTAALVKRVRSIIDQARRAVELERPSEVFIFELGDVCEGNANRTSQSQLAANDLSQAEQLEVDARLLLEAVAALAPLCERLVLVSVRSNHGEERRGGQTVGRGDFGIMTARVIKAALELAGGEWADRVRVITQSALETGVGVHVQGLPVAAFHGHYAKSERNLPDWVARQSGCAGESPAGECFRKARVVLHGHFHHLRIEQSRGRVIIGCPSLEAGSAWVERAQGEASEPGALALRVRAGRLLGVELLRPTAGMEVDRRDPDPTTV